MPVASKTQHLLWYRTSSTTKSRKISSCRCINNAISQGKLRKAGPHVSLLHRVALALQLHAPLFADSIKEVAINTTLKLLHYLNRTDVPLAVSTLQPRNAFPMLYRAGPLAADVLPALNPPNLQLEALSSKVVSKQAGQDALTQLLLKQEEPVTIIATGGCDRVMGVSPDHTVLVLADVCVLLSVCLLLSVQP